MDPDERQIIGFIISQSLIGQTGFFDAFALTFDNIGFALTAVTVKIATNLSVILS